MNECGACGLDFGSVEAFDRHRVGVHAYTFAEGARREPPVYDGRRCLAEHEIETLEDPRTGSRVFSRNARGGWSLRKRVEGARERTVGLREASS